MNCPSVQQLQGLLDESVPASQRPALEGHVEQCSACQAMLGTLSDDQSLSSIIPKPEPGSQQCSTWLEHVKSRVNKAILADAPTQIGRYRILLQIGSGGMGTVYQALDPELQRAVAVKVPRFEGLPEECEQSKRRFLREARAAAAIRHPHVCPIYDVGEHEGVPFVVMACLEGPSLSEELANGRALEIPEAVRLVQQIALALEEVHQHGIVHRDIKPGNVLLDNRRRAMLTDFGLARAKLDIEHLTGQGQIVGTIGYMAPEQCTDSPVGPAADIYSLGVVLYRMITGRLPLEGSALSVLRRIGHEEPPPPSRFRADVDLQLEQIILKAMASDPENRFRSARAFAEALEDWSSGSGVASVSSARSAGKPRSRRKAILWTLCSVAVVLAIAAGVMLAVRPKPEKNGPLESPQLTNTVWLGSEDLGGFGLLEFRFGAGNRVEMIDARQTWPGEYGLNGDQIQLKFHEILYSGTMKGSVITGSAEDKKARWKWTVGKLRDLSSAGVTIEDHLTADDPSDPNNIFKRPNARHRVYPVVMAAGRTYKVDLSAAFDSLLRLEDRQGKTLTWAFASGPNKLDFPCREEGTYRLIVGADGQAGGPFTLRVRQEKPPDAK